LPPVITSWTQAAWIALDILLVSLLIYQVLVMIRGTRAVPMLIGVTVVAVTFYLARIGELTTLNWVVSRFAPYLVFALIVVFQSEIRHVLADLGRRLNFLRGSSAETDSYDDIVLAANLFSQHQTGALIVIEREIGLRTHIESGVPLDARLSYDLLATIFRPSAPLHDGAVIVQKDRIAVICSEETGAISFAVGGKIERDLTVEQLRERLGAELRRHMTPVALPTPITQNIDDESDAAMDSPLLEPAPQPKSEPGSHMEPRP
jgi:diadenylate cyclase